MPVKNLPEPPPPKPNLGKPGFWEGYYSSTVDGIVTQTQIHKVDGVDKPRRRDGHYPFFVQKSAYGYTWYDAVQYRYRGKVKREKLIDVLPVDRQLVNAYRRHYEWKEKYSFRAAIGLPVYDLVVEAGRGASQILTGLQRRSLVVRFAVKYWHKGDLQHFARHMSKAVNLSEKTGYGLTLQWFNGTPSAQKAG
jgi:hypothetical protein